MQVNGNGQPKENGKKAFDFSTSDFANVLKTKSFVDKTLMIRDVFSGPSKILITAPPRFGKSTIIDMVKRFLEIEVDKQCIRKATNSTKNYKLFKDNKLLICKHEEFFNKHFGKHPVILIDFEPLSGARDFQHMLDLIRAVIRKSFNQHRYLLNANNHASSSCWDCGFDINDFKKHIYNRLIGDIDALDLMSSLEHLAEVLYVHFEKKVFVLIDNCDAFLRSTLSSKDDNPDIQVINCFVEVTIENLLNNNRCVKQALLTGVLPVVGDESFFSRCYIECYYFMGNHPFCKYFGLTSNELESLLEKLVLSKNERTKMKLKISEFYSGYFSVSRSIQVYNILSILQYVCKREVQNYRRYIQGFEPLFKHFLIRCYIALALLGRTAQLDMSQTLAIADIIEFNKTIRNGYIENSHSSVAEKFFLLLYHFGYLSIKCGLPNGLVSLQIPNEGIKYEVANIFIQVTQLYRENSQVIYNIWFSIESIRPDIRNQRNQKTTFKALGEMINILHQVESPDEHEMSGILFILFIILLAQSKHNKTLYLTSGTSPNKVSRILLKNKHAVIICITTFCTPEADASEAALMTYAEATHSNTIALGNKIIFSKYSQFSNKVIIAIASKVGSSGICVAYSYYFCEGDSLECYKTLAVGFQT